VLEALRSEPGRLLLAEIDHQGVGRYETLRNPVRIDGQRLPIRSPAPALGEHTVKILRELGLSGRATSGGKRGRRRG